MNWFSKESKLYKVIDFEIKEKNFDIILNESNKNILGFLCKFADSDGLPINIFKSDSFLSISQIVVGDIFNYELEEKNSFDMLHYTNHQQFMNNLPATKVVWLYFFRPYTNRKIKLSFDLEHSYIENVYLYINLIYYDDTTPNKTISQYIIDCAKDDFNIGFDNTNIGYIQWMYNEIDDDDIKPKENSDEFNQQNLNLSKNKTK
jgi:hypothetical protein